MFPTYLFPQFAKSSYDITGLRILQKMLVILSYNIDIMYKPLLYNMLVTVLQWIEQGQ